MPTAPTTQTHAHTHMYTLSQGKPNLHLMTSSAKGFEHALPAVGVDQLDVRIKAIGLLGDSLLEELDGVVVLILRTGAEIFDLHLLWILFVTEAARSLVPVGGALDCLHERNFNQSQTTSQGYFSYQVVDGVKVNVTLTSNFLQLEVSNFLLLLAQIPRSCWTPKL